jgi:hypothetical protein
MITFMSTTKMEPLGLCLTVSHVMTLENHIANYWGLYLTFLKGSKHLALTFRRGNGDITTLLDSVQVLQSTVANETLRSKLKSLIARDFLDFNSKSLSDWNQQTIKKKRMERLNFGACHRKICKCALETLRPGTRRQGTAKKRDLDVDQVCRLGVAGGDAYSEGVRSGLFRLKEGSERARGRNIQYS